MKKLILLIACLILTCTLTACKKPGSEFLGEWEHTRMPDVSLVIERNSGNFLVRLTGVGYRDGKPETKNFPATYEGGTLAVRGGYMNTTFMVDDSTGLLTDGNNQYKRKIQ